MPGGKSDVMDVQWLCQLLEAGLVRPSLVPPAPVRAMRELTSYRRNAKRATRRPVAQLEALGRAVTLTGAATWTTQDG